MARRPGLVVVLALGACGHPPGTTIDAANGDGETSDATTITVTGRDVVRDVRCTDATRTPQVVEVPWSMISAALAQPDGTSANVAVGVDGRFAFDVAPGPYRIVMTQDADVPIEYALAAPQLDIAARVVGRYDRVIAPAGTKLQVAITGTVPSTGLAYVLTTGVWTTVARPSGTNGAFTVDWSTQPLVDATKFDRAYWAVIDQIGAPAYYAVTTSCFADVTMTAGATTQLACAGAALALDHCVHLQLRQVEEADRLAAAAAVTPSTPPYTSAASSWTIVAPPTSTMGPLGGLFIASQDTSTLTSDVDRNVTFAVPFSGHGVAIALTVVRYRATSLPGAAATTLYAYTQHFIPPAGDCSVVTPVSGGIAIATLPALDGVQLANDNLGVAIDRTSSHTLTWDIAAVGALDYWNVRLWQVSAPSGATRLDLRRTWATTNKQLVIDPGLFAQGSTYLFEVIAEQAYPNAAQGDFRTLGYPATPYALSSIPSATFQVTD